MLATKGKITDKITMKPSKIINPIIADGKIISIDKVGEVEHSGIVDIRLNEKEVQCRFDKFVNASCAPFAPKDSGDRIKRALYQFMEEKYKFKKYEPAVQRIILGKENIQYFIDLINLAKEQYMNSITASMPK